MGGLEILFFWHAPRRPLEFDIHSFLGMHQTDTLDCSSYVSIRYSSMAEEQASISSRCRDEKMAKKMNLPFRFEKDHQLYFKKEIFVSFLLI